MNVMPDIADETRWNSR